MALTLEEQLICTIDARLNHSAESTRVCCNEHKQVALNATEQSLFELLRNVVSKDVRNMIYQFAGAYLDYFLLNLDRLQCIKEVDSSQWIQEKSNVMNEQHKYHYLHTTIDADIAVATAFKSILFGPTSQIADFDQDVFIFVNSHQGGAIHTHHEDELQKAYQRLRSGAGSTTDCEFSMFVHWICFSGVADTVFGRHGVWVWHDDRMSNEYQFFGMDCMGDMRFYKMKTRLIVKQMIQLFIPNTNAAFWYLNVKVVDFEAETPKDSQMSFRVVYQMSCDEPSSRR